MFHRFIVISPWIYKYLLLNDLSSVHLTAASRKLLKVSLDMSTDETLAGLVEDLLEALVAGHLHAQLHHLVNLLRLVLALVHHGVLSPLFHHLGGTGSNRLLSDGLSHAWRQAHHVSSESLFVELAFVVDPAHHVEDTEVAFHLLLDEGLDVLDRGTVISLALALALAPLALNLLALALALAPPPVQRPSCLLSLVSHAGHQGHAQLVAELGANRATKSHLESVEPESFIVPFLLHLLGGPIVLVGLGSHEGNKAKNGEELDHLLNSFQILVPM